MHRALATTHIARNDLSAADAALREAMRLEANADLAGTLPASLTQGAYGWLLHLQGKDDEAMRTLAASLDVQRPALGDLHPDVGRTLVRLGEIECSNGRASAGREHLGQGLQALQTLADAARPALERAAKSLNQCNFLASR